jgi:hypothetical protein
MVYIDLYISVRGIALFQSLALETFGLRIRKGEVMGGSIRGIDSKHNVGKQLGKDKGGYLHRREASR